MSVDVVVVVVVVAVVVPPLHCLLFFPSVLPSSYFAFKPMNSSGTAANLELEQLLSKKMSLF